jgi:hypothetical protein
VYIPISCDKKREPAGRGAMFCPVCRDLCAAEAVRECRAVTAFHFFALWRWGRRCELTCPTCRAVFHRAADYPCIADAAPGADPIDLLADADDALIDSITARDDLEQKRRFGKLTRQERDLLLSEPFEAMAHRSGEVLSTRIPTLAGFMIIGLLFAIPITIAVMLSSTDLATRAIALLVCAAMALLLTVDLFIWEPRRDRRSVYSHLARALAPLTPSDDELGAVLLKFQRERNALARAVRLSALRRHIERVEADLRSVVHHVE